MTRRVLVVDDDDDIREVAQYSLELVAGWDVDVASGGQEAVELCRASPPDAILLDVMMPLMDGPTTFATLQADARTRDIPVILLTAKVQPAERRRWDGLGVAGVLAKPFDPLGLSGEVEKLLGWDR
ncbi:two-component system response regulator [Nocardioides gansuensis]|uniref:Two-component system response regulator n=1 Tax=Nocardioides gansuensis TaxID=2138300 RepID=A0A2T8FE97_9ACTN|nr:response regulator [Nocardioides gansuensis]PVG84009.1 two-component system response regulator [Nocardioides gansuensis]